jgi:hypothetical protein
MVERREMLGGGLLAGLAGAITTASTGAAGDAAVEDTSEAAAGAVDRLRASLEREATPGTVSPSVAAIRQQQRTYIRSHDKYPDFIEVGLGVWEDIYDWHVRYRMPITAARLADGRYVLGFMFTNLILRPDQALDFVGFGFDNEPARRPNP